MRHFFVREEFFIYIIGPANEWWHYLNFGCVVDIHGPQVRDIIQYWNNVRIPDRYKRFEACEIEI